MLGVLIPLWFWERRTFTNRVMRLMTDKTDPAGAKAKVDALYAAEEEKEKRLRAELWVAAQTDTGARAKLRRRLENDVKRVGLARRYVDLEDEALKAFEDQEQKAKEQLARLDAMNRPLSP